MRVNGNFNGKLDRMFNRNTNKNFHRNMENGDEAQEWQGEKGWEEKEWTIRS